MTTLLVRSAVVVVLLLTPLACTSGGDSTDPVGPVDPVDPPPSQSTVDTVRITGVSFDPEDLTVSPGRTVVWVNTDPMFHTVTPEGHTQWSESTTSAPGEVMRVTFNSTGTFPYYCRPHQSAGMTGSIVVRQ